MDWTRLRRSLVVVALLGATVLVLVLAEKQRSLSKAYTQLRLTSMVTKPGDFVPAFTSADSGGAPLTVGEGAPGSRQLLLVVSKTCPFCRRTLPSWRAIASKVAPRKNIHVVAVALDSANATRAYLRRSGIVVPVVEFPNERTRRLYRAVVTPQTLVVDDSGRVLYSRPAVIEDPVVADSVYRAALRPIRVPPPRSVAAKDSTPSQRSASPR